MTDANGSGGARKGRIDAETRERLDNALVQRVDDFHGEEIYSPMCEAVARKIVPTITHTAVGRYLSRLADDGRIRRRFTGMQWAYSSKRYEAKS